MEYRLRIDDQTYCVEATPLDETGTTTIRCGNDALKVKVDAVSPNHLHVTVDGRAMNLFVAPTAEGTWVWADGRARVVQDADKVERRRARGPGDRFSDSVTPPTPATVVRIMTEVGQSVEKGQPLVVVSAMKMEMTLSAPYSGKISAINAEVGAKVSPGQILVDIELIPETQANERT
jgi:biotin carboxyl carrier protein